MSDYEYDLCIVGSGAGAGPVALTLSQAGYSVLILEKGPWWKEHQFRKDELACCRRELYSSSRQQEPQVVEQLNDEMSWEARPTPEAGMDFWNGNCVGGSSNFMSAFFHRLKPVDFHLLSEFGPIDGANVADWPISYEELEPWYDKVEKEVGLSGRVVDHPHLEPRSSADYPHPPLSEHPIAGMIDQACDALGYHSIPTPRGILSQPKTDSTQSRGSCSHNGGYCGSTGCSTGAKGSSRAALLDRAVATGNCEIRPHSMVTRLQSDASGNVTAVEYRNREGVAKQVAARTYVVACQAIESARLLLNSNGPKHPNGLANGSSQVGQNLIFAAGGGGSGRMLYSSFDEKSATTLSEQGTFINRALQDWYVIDDPQFGPRQKGGTIDFIEPHPAPVTAATRITHGRHGLIWGKSLKRQMEAHFLSGPQIKIEAFCDWLPIPDCRVTIDPEVKDRWGTPAARVRTGFHFHNLSVGWYLAERGAEVLKKMGASRVASFASHKPPTNLQAGTCRFGDDPATSVLDRNCRAHEVENLYVTDGSFMPTGGSAPYTLTIYANAFRVANHILQEMGGKRS